MVFITNYGKNSVSLKAESKLGNRPNKRTRKAKLTGILIFNLQDDRKFTHKRL